MGTSDRRCGTPSKGRPRARRLLGALGALTLVVAACGGDDSGGDDGDDDGVADPPVTEADSGTETGTETEPGDEATADGAADGPKMAMIYNAEWMDGAWGERGFVGAQALPRRRADLGSRPAGQRARRRCC